MNTKTAVYLRVSTGKGAQRTDSQEFETRRYCSARGWTNLEIYVDKMSGGKTTRPALDRMVQDMRDGKIARVVVYKLARCGRSLTHLCLLIDEMNRLGRILRAFRVPKDILVFSAEELRRRAGSRNHVIGHAVREGRLLYARP